MKRGAPLKRKTPLKSRQGIKTKPGRAQLAQVGRDSVPQAKKRIQALLRLLAIERDGGCVLRHFPDAAGACGGYRKDGELILQAEHLVTRANSISFADMRNIVCLCAHHHGRFKPQHSRLYWQLIEQHIGPERSAWMTRVEGDKRPYRFGIYEWLKIEMALSAEYERLSA